MPFSDEVKAQAFKRSGGRCECQRKTHGHPGRCKATITKTTVEYHHLHAESEGGHNGLSNCEALCRSCHHQTSSYGRH